MEHDNLSLGSSDVELPNRATNRKGVRAITGFGIVYNDTVTSTSAAYAEYRHQKEQSDPGATCHVRRTEGFFLLTSKSNIQYSFIQTN